MTARAGPGAKVVLAHEPDFRLGGLAVRPSACRIAAAGREQRLEPRVMEVLIVLARAAGATVTRDELIEACWGGRFVSDDAVARVIAQVRNLARNVDPAPFTLETLPKVGFRLVVADADPATEAPPPASDRRPSRLTKGGAAAVAAAVLGVLLIGGGGLWWAARGVGQNGRVEVMQFAPLQADPQLRRVSVALGDAVVRVLTSNGIKTSQRPTPRDAGGGPGGAEFRIAGAVDRDGGQIVVNAQILERRTGDVLWSGRFAREAAQATGFQEEAASRIGDVLHCALGSRTDSNRRIDAPLLGQFLNACEHWRFRDAGDVGQFLEATRRIVVAAPDYSVAQSMHAIALAVAARTEPADTPRSRALRQAVNAAAARALALDHHNGEAYFALGISRGNGAWLEQERDYQRAAELSPELSVVRNYYAGFLRDVGRVGEALEITRRTTAADPFSPTQLRLLAFLNAASGDLASAHATLDRLDLVDAAAARSTRFQVAFWWEAPAAAAPRLRALNADNSDAEISCLETYLRQLASHHGPMRGLAANCAELQPDWRVRMLSREGDVDGAYAEYARIPLGTPTPTYLFPPAMKAFRQDPRFMPLAKRLGLVAYWKASGHWPDFCAEPDLPYDCRRVAAAL